MSINDILESFMQIDLLDKILLIILILSLLFKGVGEIVCRAICKNFNTDKTYSKQCIYLVSGKTHDCKLQKCKKKYFKDEKCNKEKCVGYRTSEYTIEQIKLLHKLPFILMTSFKWISDLSTILLIIRTLLISSAD